MAFFHDMRPKREPFLRAPAAVLWLIGALLAAHALRVWVFASRANEILINYAFIPARYSAETLAAHGAAPLGLFAQAVTFVSYIFLHANFVHAGVNSLWLLAFGTPVARRLGSPGFLIFFFFCGIAAAAAHLAVNWGSLMPVVGASGAVAGLIGAGIRILYRDRNLVFGTRPALAPLTAPPVIFFSVMWTLINIVAGVTGLGTTDNMSLIAWEVHLGGYFTGLLGIGLFDALGFGGVRPRTA